MKMKVLFSTLKLTMNIFRLPNGAPWKGDRLCPVAALGTSLGTSLGFL
jgi:hypothetical protein